MQNPAQSAFFSPRSIGYLSAISAFILWGGTPWLYKTLGHVSALEIIAHRVVWSLPLCFAIVFMRTQWSELTGILRKPAYMAVLAFTSLMIGLNWLIYVYGIVLDRVIDVSLGYFICPLMTVFLGFVFLRERLDKLQLAALLLATLGVVALSVVRGKAPLLAIALALFFALYALARKKLPIGAVPGLLVETLFMLPFALLYLVWLHASGAAFFASGDMRTDGLLIFSGIVTALPLVLFAIGARRLPLSSIGFFQYIAPSMQFCLGLAYGEPFSTAQLACFSLIWLAVALFCLSLYKNRRKPRKPAVRLAC